MSDREAVSWEYETVRPPRGETKKEAENPKTMLNRLGAEGWEFIQTVDSSVGSDCERVEYGYPAITRRGPATPGRPGVGTRAVALDIQTRSPH